MVFLNSIPAATDLISNSQGQLLANNQQLDTSFGIDHTAFSVNTNPGMHKKVSFLQQGGDPTAAANTVIEYSKLSSAVNELFMRRATGDGSTVIQLTNKAGDPVAASNGKTFLPGGLILQWGSAITGAGSSFLFPVAFPTNCFGLIANVLNINAGTVAALSVQTASLTRTGCNFQASFGGGGNVFYIGIGN